jgi:hypothetical protein
MRNSAKTLSSAKAYGCEDLQYIDLLAYKWCAWWDRFSAILKLLPVTTSTSERRYACVVSTADSRAVPDDSDLHIHTMWAATGTT